MTGLPHYVSMPMGTNPRTNFTTEAARRLPVWWALRLIRGRSYRTSTAACPRAKPPFDPSATQEPRSRCLPHRGSTGETSCAGVPATSANGEHFVRRSRDYGACQNWAVHRGSSRLCWPTSAGRQPRMAVTGNIILNRSRTNDTWKQGNPGWTVHLRPFSIMERYHRVSSTSTSAQPHSLTPTE